MTQTSHRTNFSLQANSSEYTRSLKGQTELLPFFSEAHGIHTSAWHFLFQVPPWQTKPRLITVRTNTSALVVTVQPADVGEVWKSSPLVFHNQPDRKADLFVLLI